MLAARTPSLRLGAALGLALAFVTLACRRQEAAPRASAPAAPPGDAATPPAAAAPADAAPPSVSVPAGFPADLPLYPGAVPVVATEAVEAGPSVVLETDEPAQKVASFYKQKLAENGWSLDGEMTMHGQYNLLASKGDRTATAVVSSEEGKTHVTLTVASEEEEPAR